MSPLRAPWRPCPFRLVESCADFCVEVLTQLGLDGLVDVEPFDLVADPAELCDGPGVHGCSVAAGV